MGGSFILVILVLGLLLRDRFAVVARSTTMQIRTLYFGSAAWCSDCSQASVLLGEVLPNIATLEMARATLLKAALFFQGLGPPALLGPDDRGCQEVYILLPMGGPAARAALAMIGR